MKVGEDAEKRLVWVEQGEYVLEFSLGWPSGESIPIESSHIPSGFYIAVRDPNGESHSNNYTSHSVFEPIDLLKLAQMPSFLGEIRKFLNEYPAHGFQRIPERLVEKRVSLENRIGRLVGP